MNETRSARAPTARPRSPRPEERPGVGGHVGVGQAGKQLPRERSRDAERRPARRHVGDDGVGRQPERSRLSAMGHGRGQDQEPVVGRGGSPSGPSGSRRARRRRSCRRPDPGGTSTSDVTSRCSPALRPDPRSRTSRTSSGRRARRPRGSRGPRRGPRGTTTDRGTSSRPSVRGARTRLEPQRPLPAADLAHRRACRPVRRIQRQPPKAARRLGLLARPVHRIEAAQRFDRPFGASVAGSPSDPSGRCRPRRGPSSSARRASTPRRLAPRPARR